jgi:formate dehydrogenase iron-sulfur subunit
MAEGLKVPERSPREPSELTMAAVGRSQPDGAPPPFSSPAFQPSSSSLQSFLAELLAEQQKLETPVARYSRHHDEQSTAPALEPVYRDLIPLTAPGPGEQYAFEVDLDACSGCKACVAGCHSLNGLDETETWRDVGLMIGGDAKHPFQQTITSACHHCADPGCLNGCPVLAYEKDPVTGIVRHLDDQCIGCSYCVLKCPYDVPKYSERLGIVRKCDMCHSRLSAGEAPACVQACPTHAIRIVKVSVQVTADGPSADTSTFLAGAPDPSLTQPTTRYVSKNPLPANLRPADVDHPKPQPAHSPLALMLLLTQIAVGLQVGSVVATSLGEWFPAPSLPHATALLRAGWAVAAAGLLASVFHLGRPLRAWRIFLGLRRSWLSREAVVFGAWFGAASLIWMPSGFERFAALEPILAYADATTALLGVIGVICSVMIYVDTGRQAWSPVWTFSRFLGTVAIAAALVLSPVWAGAVLALKLGIEALSWRCGPMASRRLARGMLRRDVAARFLCGALGAGLLAISGSTEPGAAICGAAFAVAGEWLERSLFFRGVNPSRMPGMPSL